MINALEKTQPYRTPVATNSVLSVSKIAMTWGCDRAATACASRSKRARRSESSANEGGRTLIAGPSPLSLQRRLVGVYPRSVADDERSDAFADECDESDLHFAAQDGDLTRVRQLLADGRSPNGFDEISKTPLHYAAENGHIAIMRVLMEAGADVNAHEEARIGNTPLRDVADECSLAVATLLVEAGADPRIPGWMQLTALHKAEQRRDQEGQRVYALLKGVADRLGDG